MRQIIISLLGVLIIGGAYLLKGHLAEPEVVEEKPIEKVTPTVFVQKVENTTTPITVTASGNLVARDRIEIFSEVQGIFEYSDKRFDEGVNYSSGSVLMRINSEEYRSNIRSQKSNLYNQMVAMLPDLKFDYPDVFPKWEAYINAFDVNALLPAFPEMTNEREKLFIAGRNINSTWHSIKNLEERLTKYTLYAPFSGILTNTTVDKGALIRAGQKLGELINPNILELEVAINASFIDKMRVGNAVSLHNIERTKTWKGKVNRLGSQVDPGSQTLKAFIRVSGKDLKEGMYLEADLTAKKEENTFEIPRKLLVENNQVFSVKDSILTLTPITPVFFKDKTVVVRGLADGTVILAKSLPGAYQGMKVQISAN